MLPIYAEMGRMIRQGDSPEVAFAGPQLPINARGGSTAVKVVGEPALFPSYQQVWWKGGRRAFFADTNGNLFPEVCIETFHPWEPGCAIGRSTNPDGSESYSVDWSGAINIRRWDRKYRIDLALKRRGLFDGEGVPMMGTTRTREWIDSIRACMMDPDFVAEVAIDNGLDLRPEHINKVNQNTMNDLRSVMSDLERADKQALTRDVKAECSRWRAILSAAQEIVSKRRAGGDTGEMKAVQEPVSADAGLREEFERMVAERAKMAAEFAALYADRERLKIEAAVLAEKASQAAAEPVASEEGESKPAARRGRPRKG